MDHNDARGDEHRERRRTRLRRAGNDITVRHRHTVMFIFLGGVPPAAPRHRRR
jgi:hypothetical protein